MSQNKGFTGERYMPSVKGNIYLEHYHRYVFASTFVSGKTVLDIACGEGYGACLLADKAEQVIGVDIDSETISQAQALYGASNLLFRVGSVTEIPLPDKSVDVVISFETIEHVTAHHGMMQEVKRVLRANGVLIISTPDRAVYSDATGFKNIYHVKELYRHEFQDLIAAHFQFHRMHGQKIAFGSVIAAEAGEMPFSETDSASMREYDGLADSTYLLAIASDDQTAISGRGGIFTQEAARSEVVQKLVEAEMGIYLAQVEAAELFPEAAASFINWTARELAATRSRSALAQMRLTTILRRKLQSRLLEGLSRSPLFSRRRREKMRRSALKRDPFAFLTRLDEFYNEFSTRLSRSKALAQSPLVQLATIGARVTAIVPNYNHARYLAQRLDSILAQTYPLIQILVLDDGSTDGSRLIIEDYVRRYPTRIQAFYNEVNSGSVFRQWQKGYELAKGDLVWICESDDFCEPDFVARLVSAFDNSSVMLAFGTIEFADEAGAVIPGLAQYREDAEAGVWAKPVVRPAAHWFQNSFGIKNVIPNVGGSLWRRVPLSAAVWDEARTYGIMGDWFLYAAMAQGGQIAFDPAARAYFRLHGANTSGMSAQRTPDYYREYFRLMTSLKKRWPISEATVLRFLSSAQTVWQNAGVVSPRFEELVPADKLLAIECETVHVLIGILGFSFGGGEIFPIHLANALVRQGAMVSLLQVTDANDHPDVRAMLNPAIPVYSVEEMRKTSGANLLREAGVSVVNSHIATIDRILIGEFGIALPYIATLHGSYEAMNVERVDVAAYADRIDHFAYTTDRNLVPFEGLGVPSEKFAKFPNAMPIDDRPFGKSRHQLGISTEAVVFTFVARGVEGKGWVEAVRAFGKLRFRRPDVPMVLIAVGEGQKTEEARTLAANDPDIHFLGYVDTISGIYRMSDVALVPTRFAGESYPLCLVQALQAGLPAVATDIGEIREMIQPAGRTAGVLVPNLTDDELFIEALTDAMERTLDGSLRARHRSDAAALGQNFDIDALARRYLALYRRAISGAVHRRTPT